MIVRPLTFPHAAIIETHGWYAVFVKSARQDMNHLIGHRSAVQRMQMTQHRKMLRRHADRLLNNGLQPADRAGNEQWLCRRWRKAHGRYCATNDAYAQCGVSLIC